MKVWIISPKALIYSIWSGILCILFYWREITRLSEIPSLLVGAAILIAMSTAEVVEDSR